MFDTGRRDHPHAIAGPEVENREGLVKADEGTTQWTIKGIDRRTLELSRLAARKRGMKFGAWVNQVLREAINENSLLQDQNPKELMEKITEMELKLAHSVGELKEQTSNLQHDVRVLHMLVPKQA